MSSSPVPGVPVVLSGPSGVGKTSVREQLLARYQDIVASISATTRAPRPGEVQGRDYLFFDRETFEKSLAQDLFLEHAEVHGEYYGTPRGPVDDQRAKGADVLLVIDVQGGAQVKRMIPESILIFLVPPSMDELRKRIDHRGDLPEEVAQLRLKNALRELAVADQYDYWVMNRTLEESVSQVRSILVADRCRRERAKPRFANLGYSLPLAD